MSKHRVAIVVPLSHRTEFTSDEEISLRHLQTFLGGYDKYLVAPKSRSVTPLPGLTQKPFPDHFFGSRQAHVNLMLSPGFYKSFDAYEYVLIYHLDALVFSDQLLKWCEMGFDYIGAPWVPHPDAPYDQSSPLAGKVGNGGFSLRKVESFLKVLGSDRYWVEPREFWDTVYAPRPRSVRYRHIYKRYLPFLKSFNSVACEIAMFSGNDDKFVAKRAAHYYPAFRIPPLETALQFAFECVPRYCFELTKRTLPFGCHGWNRYDRPFWEPFLLT